MYCQKCGSENRSNAKYCLNCGTFLSPIPESHSVSQGSGGGSQFVSPERQQNTFYNQQPMDSSDRFTRHWTVTLACVVWILTLFLNLYAMAFGFYIRYNPEIGVGILLSLLSFVTSYDMYDADKEGLYTAIIAIIVAFAWDAFIGSLLGIFLVIIITIITIFAAPHLTKEGIRLNKFNRTNGTKYAK